MTPFDAPPLPKLGDGAVSDSSAQNDWRTLVEAVPLFAESALFVASKTIPIAGRSPFRTGVIWFSEDGIIIEGRVTKPPPRWLPYATIFAMIPQLCGQILASFGKRLGIPRTARVALLFLGISFVFIPIFLRRRTDQERVDSKQFLSWESLQAVQVHPKLTHVTLVYASTAVPPASVTPLEFISLSKLDPNTAQAVATTVRHFAPHVSSEEGNGGNSPLKRRIVLLTVITGLLFLLTGLLLVYFNRRTVP